MKHIKLNNSKIIILYSFIAVFLAIWFFTFSIEIDIPISGGKGKLEVAYQKKLSKSFYHDISSFNIYDQNSHLMKIKVDFIKVTNDTVFYNASSEIPENYSRSTVNTKVYKIF